MKESAGKPSAEFPGAGDCSIKTESPNPRLIRMTANREGLLALSRRLERLAQASSECREALPADPEQGTVALEIVRVDRDGRRNLDG